MRHILTEPLASVRSLVVDPDVRTTVQFSTPAALAVRLRAAIPAGERSPLICQLIARELDRLEAADREHAASAEAVIAAQPSRRAKR